ncbi:beta-lactamase domain protein [Desulfatibacillum aliphaticivorans]|uniref:Beta-lactamase domain protein n=1 Tax=Desulfatibacillum aliphaticivorans TaxID=218208 RepID=B8FFW6_DESAL|nr:MBL fold metallo-hydrolase [Desulfatibacillum aliphaticivorans]ACL03521.1 beta-lactamase domain protein [Desulfatibacillum aliphaticivorans]
MSDIEKPQVKASFRGTNCLVLKDGKSTLLVDPYFTRVDAKTVFLKKIQPNPKRIEKALNDAQVDQADAILITHAHFDHALDLAHVAKATGAVVYGCESVANVCRGGDLPEDQICVVDPQKPVEIGDFSVRFIPGIHLAFPFILRLLLRPGRKITAPLRPPARSSAWAEGQVHALHVTHPAGTFFNQGSANWVEGSLKGYEADVAFLGVGGLDLHKADYWDKWYAETAGYVNPKQIYWTHWDDFCLSLDEKWRYLRQVDTVLAHLTHKLKKEGGPPEEKMPWLEWIDVFA